MSSYQETTAGITITVEPVFLPERSQPADDQYFWAYHIRIENMSETTVQLLNRYWHIADAQGRIREVRGPGVVGEQPVLQPGDSFEYTSGVPLTTPSGMMSGHFEMQDEDGKAFDVTVPAFSLDSPDVKVRPN